MALEDQDETKNLDGFLSSAEKSATDDTDNIGQEDLQKQEEAPWVNGYQINKDYSTKKKDLKDQQ